MGNEVSAQYTITRIILNKSVLSIVISDITLLSYY